MTRMMLSGLIVEPDGETEAELVVAEVDGGVLSLTLDDGRIVVLDAGDVDELLSGAAIDRALAHLRGEAA